MYSKPPYRIPRIPFRIEIPECVMDTPEDVVFKIHHGGVFFFDPLRDSDLEVVYDMAKKHDYLHLYVAHEPQLLAEYYDHNLRLEGSDEEAEEEAKSPYLRSPPKRSTPVRNGFKGKALFAGTYDEYDTGCAIPLILDEDEVGKEDLVAKANVMDNVVVDQVENVVEEHRVDEHRVEVEETRVDENTVEVEEPRVDEHRVDVEEPRVDEHRVDVEEASIDAEVLARQKTLNKGKGVLTKQDIVKNRKRNTSPRGNGITIRENEGPLSSETDSDDSEVGDEYANYYSETESHDSDKSFDYLSDIEDDVIELRKRKRESKKHADKVIDDPEPPGYDDMAPSLEYVGDLFGETVREHEHYMEFLMRKLKGNGEGVSDPFVMVEKPDDKYPIYNDQTHWRLKKPKKTKFKWSEEVEKAFQALKVFLIELLTLTTPFLGETLTMYLAASNEAIGSVLVADRDSKQMPIYFISKALHDAKLRYPSIENLAYALYISAKLLRKYFQAHPKEVITDQPLKQVLPKPKNAGRLTY
ncbi:hypothetical protein CTI12_AA205210 [Artemisia annua]|uniref:Reverse transcriptase/retrotransposon-derived protein RNase H-like domain-containing protein n=1 Tax=Artemisia annua TaxID=35608 RepID=A0A2U1P1F6_ARTAN|nr:hypothetical protein CTI12_AA205210 [Artemisia annua]